MQLESGVQIGRYTLEKPLGSGSSGEVWLAHNGTHAVAIKFILQAANSAHRESLEAEIKALRRLENPHIPAFYDSELKTERPYLVMQYIGSRTYDKLIASGEMLQVGLEKRLNALEVIAETIHAAHTQGIIHRDIKPANLAGIEKPYLLDFSVALEAEHSSLSRQDVGTGIYMPPLSEPSDILSDNYSFAVTVYEVIFGLHPIFTPYNVAKTVITNRQLAGQRLLAGTWRAPSRIPPHEVPRDLQGVEMAQLDSIFQRALGARAERYRNPVDLVRDLKAAALTPANQPYLHQAERLSFQNPPIPTDEHYTFHEMFVAAQDTNHGLPRPTLSRSVNGAIIAAALLIACVLIGLLLRGS